MVSLPKEVSKGNNEVDATGIEPVASPLQGERSTTDLRAQWADSSGMAHFVTSMIRASCGEHGWT